MTNIIHSLYQINAIQFGEFKLKSGITSPIYINLRKIISHPRLLTAIAEKMWEKIQTCQFDLICGVPYTALPIATCISLAHQIPMIMRRKEKKDYGTKQLIEGEFKSGQTCLIVEDIVTTGSSIIETAHDLEKEHLKITDVIAVIDRESSGTETLAEKFRLQTLFTLTEVLHTLLNSSQLPLAEKKRIQHFLEDA